MPFITKAQRRERLPCLCLQRDRFVVGKIYLYLCGRVKKNLGAYVTVGDGEKYINEI